MSTLIQLFCFHCYLNRFNSFAQLNGLEEEIILLSSTNVESAPIVSNKSWVGIILHFFPFFAESQAFGHCTIMSYS